MDAPLGNRRDRWFASYTGPSTIYLPLVMVDGGHQMSNGDLADFAGTYRRLIDAERPRPPLATIEAYTRRVDGRVRAYVRLHNLSGATLDSATNHAALSALVWEDKRVGDTGRIVRGAPFLNVAPAVPDGGELTATVDTPDLAGVGWDALHTVVVADWAPGPGPAFDMLQAAVAEPAGFVPDPATLEATVDTGHPANRTAEVAFRGPYVLRWTGASDAAWLLVAPAGGDIATPAAVTVAAGALANGSQVGHVTFSATSQDGMAFTAFLTVDAFAGARRLRVGDATATAGGGLAVPIEMTTLGDEHAVRFSVRVDPEVLSAPTAALGNGAGAASLTTDESEIASGRIGINVVLPDGATLPRGESDLVVVSFAAAGAAAGRTTSVALGDEPTLRGVVDTAGAPLTAAFADGSVTVPGTRTVGPPRRRIRRPGV